MPLDIDPKVDYAFKRLFGRDDTRSLLIQLLEAVLELPSGFHITDIELLNPFNPKENADDKLSILDIKARDQKGRQINIEMQMIGFKHLDKRLLYYWAKFHTQQLHEEEDYVTLQPTISISFLNHVLFPDAPGYHHHFRLLEVINHFPLSQDLEFHVIELPKFEKCITELISSLDKWLYFLRHAAMMDLEALPVPFRDPIFERAFQELKMTTQTDVEREKYEARRKFQLDYNTGMKVARMEGREEGREEGLKQGRKEGDIGIVQFCQRLLGQPMTPREELLCLSGEELTHLALHLREEVSRGR
jgi:predicted transposase/invertase (TIGR01784 family)